MAEGLVGALQGAGGSAIERAVRGVVGQAAATIRDDDQFRLAVIDVAWNLMPTPVRLIGRQRLGFDALLLRLRASVFDLSTDRVQLRGDLAGGISAAVLALMGALPGTTPPPPSPEAGRAEDSAITLTPVAPAPLAAPPPRPEPAVGIDLGTTFSVVAYLDPMGRPWTITNSEGDLTTPSVVLVEGQDEYTVGREAVRAAAALPDQVAQFAKREMGNAQYPRPLLGQSYPPEVLQSIILRKLKHDAEDRIGPFGKAVITVPAYFNEPRRRATFEAGRLAGLDVLDIINEPTAAALAFGVQQGFLSARGEARSDELVLVYDLGGGTFDVTLMAISGANYQARATAGDVHLGGIDWDGRIVDLLAQEFRTQHRGQDPRQHPGGLQRLQAEAEAAKRALSARDRTAITFDHAGQAIRLTLTRDHFEAITRDLLERTRFTANRVLREAQAAWADLTRILLVGGSTRMPMVARMLEAESGLKVDRSLSPDESVAHGAAIYAGLLLAHDAATLPSVRVRNVSSHALGVLGVEPQTGLPRTKVMIPANTPLPSTRQSQFRTHRAGQRSIAVRVVEGGDASGQNSTALGTCAVRDLPPDLPAGTPVVVRFRYESNGVLGVEASLPGLNRSVSLSLDRAPGLTEPERAAWASRLAAGSRPLGLD